MEHNVTIFTKVSEVQNLARDWKKQGLTIGLVPTMGYLHAGHKSLIDRAAAENDRVIVSIFVNPIQFGPTEDLSTYPRDLEADKKLCSEAGAHIIFHPTPEEMYPPDFVTHVDVEQLTSGLCGQSRPTHFRGVTTVVSKLFLIAKADRAYFGEKDAQQLAVIRRMARDLNFDIEIVGCPIIREEDGLAKSSRNKYLNPQERQAALVLSQGLKLGQEALEAGNRDAASVIHIMTEKIKKEPLAEIDYISIVDALSLEPVQIIEKDVLVAMAVKIGTTRLIDNFTFFC